MPSPAQLALPVLALLLCAPTADALSPSAERDYRFALRLWGETPKHRCLFVERATVPRYFLGKGRLGEATETRAGRRVPCTLYLRKRLPRCIRRQVIVHEVGHLLGRPHSDDPASIMYPRIVSRWRPDLCSWQGAV